MMKAQTGEGTGTFHMENFRRRSRYAAVFAVLAAALFAILILNINTGTTNIPVSRILKIIFLRKVHRQNTILSGRSECRVF